MSEHGFSLGMDRFKATDRVVSNGAVVQELAVYMQREDGVKDLVAKILNGDGYDDPSQELHILLQSLKTKAVGTVTP